MKLRKEFVDDAADPDRSIAEVCRDYGISRKTGYKWIKRHDQQGELGLCNRSRRPHGRPLETSAEMALRAIELRREKPRRGPKKIHELLVRAHGAEAPSERTIARILERAGLVRRVKQLPVGVKEHVVLPVWVDFQPRLVALAHYGARDRPFVGVFLPLEAGCQSSIRASGAVCLRSCPEASALRARIGRNVDRSCRCAT